MAKTLDPVSRLGRVAFELDRFELVGDDSYAVQGRWFGVRGRRFIRPTLTVLVDGQRVRLLADLAHKPWAAEDGQPWEAAFPCRRVEGEVLEVELAVAPDLLLTLPAPGEGTGDARPTLPAGQETAGWPPPAGRESRDDAARGSEDVTDRDRVSALTRDLAQARETERELKRQLDRSAAHEAEADGRMDEVLGNLSRAMRDRDEAQAARDRALAERDAIGQQRDRIAQERDAAQREGGAILGERDQIAGERDQIAGERDQIAGERDQIAGERDQIAAQRDEALRARERALRARASALRAREEAITARDQALQGNEAGAAATNEALAQRGSALETQVQAQAERDAAVSALQQAQAERDAALLARDHARHMQESLRTAVDRSHAELARHASSEGAAMVMRRAFQEPQFFRPAPRLVARALAVIGLLAVVVLLLIVLRVV